MNLFWEGVLFGAIAVVLPSLITFIALLMRAPEFAYHPLEIALEHGSHMDTSKNLADEAFGAVMFVGGSEGWRCGVRQASSTSTSA